MSPKLISCLRDGLDAARPLLAELQADMAQSDASRGRYGVLADVLGDWIEAMQRIVDPQPSVRSPIELGKRYTTRNGRPIRLLCVDAAGSHPVIGLDDGETRTWTAGGLFDPNQGETMLDLIEVQS